jgi:hypothetical protein
MQADALRVDAWFVTQTSHGRCAVRSQVFKGGEAPVAGRTADAALVEDQGGGTAIGDLDREVA